MKRFVLHLDPSPIEFTNSALAAGPFPYLDSVGNLRESVRAGHEDGIGVGESTSLEVALCNPGRHVAGIVGRPLRALGEVFDGDRLYFAGYVQSVRYGTMIRFTLEA